MLSVAYLIDPSSLKDSVPSAIATGAAEVCCDMSTADTARDLDVLGRTVARALDSIDPAGQIGLGVPERLRQAGTAAATTSDCAAVGIERIEVDASDT